MNCIEALKHIVFKHGALNILECDGSLFGFERVISNRKVLIYVNAGNEAKTLNLDGVFTNYETAKQVKGKVKLAPFKYLILTK